MKLFASSGGSGNSDYTTSVSPKDDVGPHIIHDGCDKASTGVDIIFVHGLRGSRVKTWSSGTCFWPRDLLSEDLSVQGLSHGATMPTLPMSLDTRVKAAYMAMLIRY
jgi:hypothetical protein